MLVRHLILSGMFRDRQHTAQLPHIAVLHCHIDLINLTIMIDDDLKDGDIKVCYYLE